MAALLAVALVASMGLLVAVRGRTETWSGAPPVRLPERPG